MKRDFTYIDDIISGTRAAIDKNYKCEIFNLGNHKSEKLMDVVSIIEKILSQKAARYWCATWKTDAMDIASRSRVNNPVPKNLLAVRHAKISQHPGSTSV